MTGPAYSSYSHNYLLIEPKKDKVPNAGYLEWLNYMEQAGE